MLNVLFRVDDGPNIGAGHLMRCLALAEAVAQGGGKLVLSTARPSPLHAEWKRLGADIRIRPRAIGSSADLDITLATAREVQADWLVVDGYEFDAAWLDAVASDHLTLCLDDLGMRDSAAHIVLNSTPGAERQYDAAYQRCGRALLGLKWFPLRNVWRECQYEPEQQRLLLTLGGEDPDNRMLQLMSALLADGRPFIADVICSAPEAGFQKIQALASAHPGRFTVHRSPVALPPLMRRASVAISGGGVTSVEAVSLGVIPIIMILASNQKSGAEYLASAGVAVVVPACDHPMTYAARSALDLLHDESLKRRLNRHGRDLIDGKGAARVVAAMKETER